MIKFIFLSLIFFGYLHAGTVHCINDSPYVLRAVIRGNDGSYLGELIVQPQNSGTWTTNNASYTYTAPNITQTPFTVIWHCMSGDDYSINTYVETGATVFAQSGQGARICRPKKKQQQQQQQQGTPSSSPK
jgi:hypothetical protein